MKLYRSAVVTLVILLLLSAAIHPVIRLGRSAPVMAAYPALPVIIIDPGHGGGDGGASANGVVEKHINLEIALAMRDMFTANGFRVIMTREEDIAIHDPGARRWKLSDMQNRLAIINENPGALFLSIHQNKFGQASANGTQVFYGPKSEQSAQLAAAVQQRFVRDLQPENHRKQKQAGKNLYLLYESENPAVMIECGFLSNAREAVQLADPEYQKKIAFTAFSAVLEYLDLAARDVEIEP